MYKAIIERVEKSEDNITLSVRYTDPNAHEKEDIFKSYTYPMVEDIENTFEQTVKSELKRINNLETKYEKLKKIYENKEVTITTQEVK